MKQKLISLFLLMLSAQGFSQNCTAPSSLLNVTRVTVPGYQKVIFTFKKPMNTHFGFTVTNTTSSWFGEGCDQSPNLAGCKFKNVTFKGAEWMCNSQNLTTTNNRIKAVSCRERFEGNLTYVIGYCTSTYHHKQIINSNPTRYKVVLWFKN
jgi:hypothetical protein